MSAKFYGTAYFTEAYTVDVRIFGQLVENATIFADGDRPSQKSPTTTNYIDWIIPTCITNDVQESPEVKKYY